MSRTRWARRAAVGVALGMLAIACTSSPERSSPDIRDRIADQPAGFEVPPIERASDLWPPLVVNGEHHEIEEEVISDGSLRTYRVRSDFGDFEVRGDDLLTTRLREIGALAAMQEISKTEEFAKAVARALATPLVTTWNLITRPVSTVAGIPAGALRFLAKTPGLTRGERGELEESPSRELIGFAAKKRELAYELGIDPYSSNRALQRELNRQAWVTYAGELPFNLAPFLRAEPLFEQLEVPVLPPTVAELLRDLSPEELRARSREQLLAMEIPGELVEEFVLHPWYSPRHQTLIVEALAGMEVTLDRAAFVRVAIGAASEEDARFYQRAAQLLHHHHRNVVPFERLVAIETLVAGYGADRSLVVPLLVDRLAWTRPAEVLADTFRRNAAELEPLGVSGIELLLSGTLTERAREELEARGIAARERALDDLTAH